MIKETRKKGAAIAGLCCIWVLVSCSPAVNRVYLTQEKLPSKPDDFPIKLYSDQVPKCPYQEIGVVTSRQRNRFVSMEEVTEALRSEARRMGGDALVKVTLGDKTMGVSKVGNAFIADHDPVLQGTVIKWVQDDCTE